MIFRSCFGTTNNLCIIQSIVMPLTELQSDFFLSSLSCPLINSLDGPQSENLSSLSDGLTPKGRCC